MNFYGLELGLWGMQQKLCWCPSGVPFMVLLKGPAGVAEGLYQQFRGLHQKSDANVGALPTKTGFWGIFLTTIRNPQNSIGSY